MRHATRDNGEVFATVNHDRGIVSMNWRVLDGCCGRDALLVMTPIVPRVGLLPGGRHAAGRPGGGEAQ